MKKRELLLALPAAACGVAFGAYLMVTRTTADHTPPVITVPEGIIQTSVQAGEEQLLHGIVAMDDQDGNVSDKVVVESISGMFEDNKTTVTYAAFDSAGNVSKATRTLQYTDYAEPRFSLSAPLIFRAHSGFNVFSPMGASDMMDGNLTSHIKGMLVSEGQSLDEPGTYQVEFRVTNRLDDTVHLTLPVEVNERGRKEGDPELTAYLVYRKVNTPFDPMIYVTEDSRERPLAVSSNVNMCAPGTYTVNYVDTRGDDYGKTRLIVVVEE